MKELRGKLQADEVVQDLIGVAESEFEAIYARHLAQFDALLAKIRATISPQEPLLGQIRGENQRFALARSQDPALVKRQQVLQALDKAYEQYVALLAHLQQGLQFYLDFHALLQKLKLKADDYVFARHTEQEMILSDMKAAAAAAAASAAAAVPPSYTYAPPPSAPIVSFPPQPTYLAPSFSPPPPTYAAPPQSYQVSYHPPLYQQPPQQSMMQPSFSPSYPAAQQQPLPPPGYQQAQAGKPSIFPDNPYGAPGAY